MTLMMNRRHAIKLISGTGLALYLAPCFRASESWGATTANPNLAEISPVNRTLGEIAPRVWYSDYPDVAHKVLWDKAGYVASLGAKAPKPTESVPLVVVGGGVAGLFSAYLLREHRPVVLEQAPRFGGNAKGQSWRGIDYSIGAAYFIEPEKDSDIEKLLIELGIDKLWKIKTGEDPVAIKGKIFTEFWGGMSAGMDEAAKAQFATLKEYFEKMNEGEEIKYPDIPITDPELLDYIKELDGETFKAHLEKKVGGPLTPHIETAIEQYCWSSMGAAASEVSAAGGLNFYAAEFGNLALLPGGNSAAAERVLEKLSTTLPKENLRADALVYDVSVVDDGVVVSYRDGGGNAHAIHAKAVVLACPKFVVNKILSGIEAERVDAIKKLRYHSYLVANVCIKDNGKAPYYDLYMLGDGQIDARDLKTAADKRKVTDVIFGNYAKPVGNNLVLTLYRGMPYDGARAEILAPDSYQRYRTEFEQQITKEILPLLGIKEDSIADLRLARWGHPLPVNAPGLIKDGVVDTLRKPFKERVFFVEQDNWALPAFETAVTEALTFAPQISDAIKQVPHSEQKG